MELGHLLTRSGLAHPEVSSMVFPGSSCLLVAVFFIILYNLRHYIYMLYLISLVVLYFVQNCGYI